MICLDFTVLTRYHMMPFGSMNQAPLRPPVTWADTLCSSQLIDLFFKVSVLSRWVLCGVTYCVLCIPLCGVLYCVIWSDLLRKFYDWI